MEERPKEEDGSDSGFDVAKSIRKLAAHNARASLNKEEYLLLFLQSWWSRLYNRPLKDPILQSYTLEDLLYEYYDRIERQIVAEERLEEEADKIEDEKEKSVIDWAEAEEKRELEEAAKNEVAKKVDPAKDPENIRWMKDQIEKAKEEFGDSFGEDIDENFEG
jgi:hypothetical protein